MDLKPGYKLTDVGVFPDRWNIARIGSFAEVEGGYAFSSKAFLASGTYQVVKMSNLYGGTLDLERSASFLNELNERERHYLLRPSHIVFTLTGTTGKRDYGYSHMITHEQNLLLNQRVGRIVVPDTVCAGYILLQVQSPCFLNQFFEVSKGGTGNQTNVGTQDVAAMWIPVPPLPEQRAIATALSDVDALLRELCRLIAKNRNIKQAAMEQLLTGQIRLPGYHDKWTVGRLGTLIVPLKKTTRQSSSGQADGAFPFFTNSTKPTDKFLDEVDFNTEAIIANTGGEAFFNYYSGRFAAMADCFVFESVTDTRFLYYSLKLIERAINENGFTGSGIKHLDKKFFGQVELRYPSTLAEQCAIAEVLSEMDAKIAAAEARLAKARQIKQGMMQELLTGRIRLIDTHGATA